jgi:DNA-binding NarL/FixJ family response regulator
MSSEPELLTEAQAVRVYRVVIAEDAYLIREGIRQVLEGEDEVEVAEYCGDLPSLERAVERHRPDVVITDIRMPPTNSDEGIQAAASLQERYPEIGVVVISQYVSPHYALKLFEHGSGGRAYLMKEHVGHRIQLMEAIREVANGGSVVDPAVVDVLVEARLRAKNSPLAQLTPREREVLSGVAEGKSNAAVASSLFLTKRAVEKNINSIFSKLGLDDDSVVSRRVQAALLFLAETGRGPPPPPPAPPPPPPPRPRGGGGAHSRSICSRRGSRVAGHQAHDCRELGRAARARSEGADAAAQFD